MQTPTISLSSGHSWEKLREGYDLVMGNRFRGAILPGAMPALHRNLDNPVLTGLLIVAGTAAWVLGLEYWRSRQFGPLDIERTLRIVIPGVVLFTLGFQAVLSSFFQRPRISRR